MQVTFFLNQETRHNHIYNYLSVSAKRYNKKTVPVPFSISEKSGLPDKEEIIETIIFLEHIVKTLEKKVQHLKEYTDPLKIVPPERVCRENIKRIIKHLMLLIPTTRVLLVNTCGFIKTYSLFYKY